jgi:hypothetical protein
MQVREATAGSRHRLGTRRHDTWQTAFRGIIPDPYIDRISADYEKRHHSCSPTA